MNRRAAAWGTGVAAAVAGTGVLALALHLGHGLDATTITGLPDAGPVTNWSLPIVTFLSNALATVTVGLTATAAFLLPGAPGTVGGATTAAADGARGGAAGRGTAGVAAGAAAGISPQAFRLLRLAGRGAVAWAVAAVALIVLTVSDVLGAPVSTLGATPVWSFATSISQGQALVTQAALALVAAGLALTALRRGTAALAAVVALIGALPPALTGHAAGAGNHQVAVTSLALHVGAAALWAGGLVALLLLRRTSTLPAVAARYSRMALGCFIVVAVSGIANAWVRVGTWSALFGSAYGGLILGKVAALLVLGGIGAAHRTRTLAALDSGRRLAFVRLAAGELVVFAATFGLAVALSRSPTPVAATGGPIDPIVNTLGFPMPKPITASRLLGDPLPDMFFLTVVAVAGWAYLAGVRRMRRAGHAWPVARTASFVAGLVILGAATNLGISRYAYVLFSAHMAQHMVLAMLVPVLLVGGAPVTLALRTLRKSPDPAMRGPREWLLIVLHSRPMRLLTHPLVALAIYVTSLYGLYFTDLLGTFMTYHLGHLLMLTHFVLSGYLMFWVLIGVDPGRRRIAPHAAILLLFASMVFHAFLGVALLQYTSVISANWYAAVHPAWAGDLLADQHVGAGIAWAFGEIPSAVVFAILVMRWMRSDAREQARLDRAAVRAEASGEEDELARYNAFLAQAGAEARGETVARGEATSGSVQ